MATPTPRRLRATLAALLLTLTALPGLAAPAHAQDGYQFWGYYRLTGGEWTFATQGPASITPPDGAVEGFRYAGRVADERPPRVEPTFEELCGDSEAGAGQKRVGIVVDYGTAADATQGEQPPDSAAGHCAVVPEDFNSQQALEAVTQVRISGDGLICGIGGYPAAGCGGPVAAADIPAEDPAVDLELTGDDAGAGDVPWALVLVGVVLLGLAGGAVVLSRRRP